MQLEDLSETQVVDGDVESRLRELRDRQDRLDTDLNQLQSIIQFNEKMLDGSSHAVTDALGASGAAPTDELLPDEDRDVTCWMCGSHVERSELEATLETFKNVRSAKLEDRSAVRDEIDELQEIKRNQREVETERRRLERRIDETSEEIEEREARIEDLETDREDLESHVEELEDKVREMQTEEQDELLGINREINELEFERDQLENDLDDVSAEIDRIESRLERREELEDEREEVSERLEDLRTRIDRMETAAVDEFNDHMERVLDILEYENLDRIWSERKQLNGDSHFDLHVIRTTEDGAAYEDSIQHLSESEREVVGLVFALAGYLVHDVHEKVPFLLLDSLEALHSGRIADLVEYFAEYADSLIVALLPEDAAVVDNDYQRISHF